MAHVTTDIRNIVFLGHGDAGKTTLADRMLLGAKADNIKGSGSVFDFDPDEKEKEHSLDVASGHCSWKGKELNIIDTPGSPDFIGEAISGIHAADMALVCVNAHSGVMVNTRRTWEILENGHKPRAIIITKCDLERERLTEVFEGVQKVFGKACVPWKAPEGMGDYRDARTEAALEGDDELMMKYLEGESIDEDALKGAARKAIIKTRLVPVLFADPESDIEEILDFVADFAPDPTQVPRYLMGENNSVGDKIEALTDAPFLGVVWKIQVDRHVGKIGHVRILSGSLGHGSTFLNRCREGHEKLSQIMRAQGKEDVQIEQGVAGDLVVMTKVDSLHIGDTLGCEEGPEVRMAPYPHPMFSLAATPKSRGDEAKISTVFAKVADECPTFRAERDASTGELVISGTSQMHLEMWLKRCKDRFGLEVETHTPRVPYKESISGAAEARYRHKKQTGGRGQFAEVALKISPAEEGAGLDYHWDIFGGSIPTNYKEAVHKGIAERMEKGVIAGYRMEDVRVSIVDGKHHDVDSSDQAFKYAAGRAFAEAVAQAKPAILEPIVKMKIHIPGECMGDISGDLNSRRGRIQGMEQDGDFQVIQAEMPLSEAMEYSRVLTSITSGEGSYSMEPSHYEAVPGNVKAELVANFKPHGDED